MTTERNDPPLAITTPGVVTTALNRSGSDVTVNDTFDLAFSSCDLDLNAAELPFILISTIVVNVVALVVLMRMRGTCDTLDHYLVSVLNFNDLLTASIYTLTWITGWASCDRLLHIPLFCGVLGWLGTALVVWSAGIIIIMTTCRYLSLVKPLYYRAKVTTRTVSKGAIGTLLLCLLFFIFPFTGLTAPFRFYEDNHICATDFAPGVGGEGQRVFIGCVGVIGCLTVLHVVLCNLTIVRTLRQRNAIHSQRTVGRAPNVDGKRRIFGHVTLVVSFVYAMCYAPFVIRLTVDTIYDLDHQNTMIHSVSMSLLFLSPLLNPIIYGVFNRQFRRTLLSMLRLPLRKQNRIPSFHTRQRSDREPPVQTRDEPGVQGGSGNNTSGVSNRHASPSKLSAVHSRATELTTSGLPGSMSIFVVQNGGTL